MFSLSRVRLNISPALAGYLLVDKFCETHGDSPFGLVYLMMCFAYTFSHASCFKSCRSLRILTYSFSLISPALNFILLSFFTSLNSASALVIALMVTPSITSSIGTSEFGEGPCQDSMSHDALGISLYSRLSRLKLG